MVKHRPLSFFGVQICPGMIALNEIVLNAIECTQCTHLLDRQTGNETEEHIVLAALRWISRPFVCYDLYLGNFLCRYGVK